MNTIKWVLLLSSLHILAGCASGKSPVTGIEGSGNGPSVDSGAAALDTDNDGISDRDDKCANTEAKALVDDRGCDIVTGVVKGLEFGPNETELSVSSRLALSKVVDAFLRYPDVIISVEGHTDNRGSAADNLELSKQRVLSVVRYMVTQGMSSDRIKPYGFGESRPRAANATAAGREQNRRIEINIVEGLL